MNKPKAVVRSKEPHETNLDEQAVGDPYPSDGAFLIQKFCTPEEKKEFARLLRIFEGLNKSEHDGVRKEILIRVEYDYRRLMDKAGRIIWENPETAWGFARARAEWNDTPLERARIYEEFALEAQERAIFQPEDSRFEKLAAHANQLAEKIMSSLSTETSSNANTVNVPKLKWQWTDTAFVLFCKLQCEDGAVPYKHEGSTTRNEIPWESFCSMYSKKDGTPFDPESLSSIKANLEREKNSVRPKKIRHQDEVTRLVELPRQEDKRGDAPKNTPRLVSGSMREATVPKSAPGRIGAARS